MASSLNVDAVVFQPGTDGPPRIPTTPPPTGLATPTATPPTDPFQQVDPWATTQAMAIVAAQAQQAQYAQAAAAANAQFQGDVWQGYRQPARVDVPSLPSNPTGDTFSTAAAQANVVTQTDSAQALGAVPRPVPSTTGGQQPSLADLLGYQVVPTPPQAQSPNSSVTVNSSGSPAPGAGTHAGLPAPVAAFPQPPNISLSVHSRIHSAQADLGASVQSASRIQHQRVCRRTSRIQNSSRHANHRRKQGSFSACFSNACFHHWHQG